jgi:hypothetical protein
MQLLLILQQRFVTILINIIAFSKFSPQFTFTLANATTCNQALTSGQVDFIITEAPINRSLKTAVCLVYPYTCTHALSLSLSHTLTLSHSHTLTLSHSHTLTRSLSFSPSPPSPSFVDSTCEGAGLFSSMRLRETSEPDKQVSHVRQASDRFSNR